MTLLDVHDPLDQDGLPSEYPVGTSALPPGTGNLLDSVPGESLGCRNLCGAGGRVFDLILEGGRVLDGAGNPNSPADVAVDGGRIAPSGSSGAPMCARRST